MAGTSSKALMLILSVIVFAYLVQLGKKIHKSVIRLDGFMGVAILDLQCHLLASRLLMPRGVIVW